MLIRNVWKKVRRVVPVSLYPRLAPLYKWDQRRTIRRLQAEDAKFFLANPGVVAPGPQLRVNVVGTGGPCRISEFLKSGEATCDDLELALSDAGARMETFRCALDFGCGCGRLLLAATKRWSHIRWYGSDVDDRATRWCVEHLTNASVLRNEASPPLPFPDAEFDLVWCGSVFTHLDESRQDAWLAELCRVLAPGGYLLASLHGPNCWEGLPAATVRRIRSSGFVFTRTGGDEGVHPEWYQTAWHTPEYIHEHWSQFLQVVRYLPERFNGFQDLVVARKPA